MTGWRVWLAFEVRPGISRERGRTSAFWRALAETCRRPDDSTDVIELDRWIDLVVEYGHAWGSA